MKFYPINARTRTEVGTRACRKLRVQGEIPANIYGKTEGKQVNYAVAVPAYDAMQAIEKLATVMQITWDGGTELVQLVEVQRDVFGDDVVHMDLHVIDASKPLQGTVQVVLRGEAKGTREGGHLRFELHELEVLALPRNMPRELVVRVDDLGIGDALHVGELPLGEGVTPISPGELVVVQVVEPTAESEEDEEEGEGTGAEPEVINKGKKEEEA